MTIRNCVVVDGLEFSNEPTAPLRYHGKLWHAGWDIPTRYAVDANGVPWMDNAHGHPLEQTTWHTLIINAEHDADIKLLQRLKDGTK